MSEPPTASDATIDESLAPGASVRRNTRYELFVLGELMAGPMHGYRLREILNRVLGPFRQISWGVIYPLIHDLEREGLIAAGEAESEQRANGEHGRQRHSYLLTDAGRARFHALMQSPIASSPDEPETFMVKLNLFGYVAPEVQRAILQHHRAYLQTALDYLSAERDFVLHRRGIPAVEREHILRLLGYRTLLAQTDAAWSEAQLTAIEHG